MPSSIIPSGKEVIRFLYGLEGRGIRPGLRRIRALLEALGHPERSCPSVLIAGTNGKGSTSAMVASVLKEAGYTVGLYTSPHLRRFNERIRVNGREIRDSDLARAFSSVKKAAKGSSGEPTFFEFTTAMAFEHFRNKAVDIAVLEVGMGGRLDATNAVTPLVSVITNIGFDHMEHLGSTIKAIAGEKAGIIKRGSIVVTAEDGRAALGVIRDAARKKGVRLLRLGKDFGFKAGASGAGRKDMGRKGFDYHGIGEDLLGLRLPLGGPHQLRNASCAIAVVEALREKGFEITPLAIRKGIDKTTWPGRLEVVSKRPLVILDCAHNPHGARALRKALEGMSFRKLTLVMGIMGDKDIEGIFSELAPLAHRVILTSPRTPRAASPGDLAERLRPFTGNFEIVKTVRKACLKALSEAGPRDAVCVTGSIFTVGEASFLRDIPGRDRG